MTGICEGRVVIVTGAGRGLGREHALEFGRQGARVVVNDLVNRAEDDSQDLVPAADVAAEIREQGGSAIANTEDISDWDGAARLIETSVNEFGELHVLVNNAGVLRDRMLVNMNSDEWDTVIRVHLRGAFATIRHASEYWRGRVKSGVNPDARIINTTSAAGLYGNIGQANYAAAKAGTASLTQVAALELARYGVTTNAIAPIALTRMTEGLPHYAPISQAVRDRPDEFHPHAAANVSPLVVWLGSTESREVTGRVFNVHGSLVGIADPWDYGPAIDNGARWDPAQLGSALQGLLIRAKPIPTNRPVWHVTNNRVDGPPILYDT
jgi:NAD(P)-dependent dehydrogenase (short-subunit alcohol dehydrogenase family)